MRQHSALASLIARAWNYLGPWLRRQFVGDIRTYHPERHYMRGPGPKCRERNGRGVPMTERRWPPSAGSTSGRAA